jgi:hypothetical protein
VYAGVRTCGCVIWMYVDVYVCRYVYVGVCLCLYMYICMCVFVCMCVRLLECVCVDFCMFVRLLGVFVGYGLIRLHLAVLGLLSYTRPLGC